MEAKSEKNAVKAQGKGTPCRGEVIYIYAYDIAYDIKNEPVEKVLGQPTKDYLVGPSKRIPRQMFFYRPRVVEFAPEKRVLSSGQTLEIRKSVKIFGVGAMTIQVRMPFEVDRLDDLVRYHDLKFADGGLEEEVSRFAESVLKDIVPYCVRPVPALLAAEAYTVFCLACLPGAADGQGIRAEDWLKANRRPVAALLMQEENAEALSEQEVGESTELYLSYYDEDLVVVDWDSALIIGQKDSLDDVLHIMELANVQLVELTAYDRVLDEALQLAYSDVNKEKNRSGLAVLPNLRELRIDLARLSDELSNITKFFGDWHLAKTHRNLADRFHLGDWQRIIVEKTRTLDGLYQILLQNRFNVWMFVLEATIVLLFIIDLVLLFVK
ncbi:MAG: hypothetical protein JW749_11310 [Sedimentisphaerales bacterium]|nr:hypothetical protein [Sedimentisphaerales bacterium]